MSLKLSLATGAVGILVSACAADDNADGPTLAAVTEDLQSSPSTAQPVPADYDGDGRTDVAVKGANGVWYIDLARCDTPAMPCQGPHGFGGRWDFAYPGYGDATAVAVPADYGRSDGSVDPEHRVDLAVKTSSGMWAIDYADNGFGVWDRMLYGYGDGTALPVPADYDGDGRADLAVKNGVWLIDYASDGFGAWNVYLPNIYGDGTWVPVPADYNGDGRADLAIKNSLGQWKIDWSNLSNTGFGAWNVTYSGYGDAGAVPVPADYDRDGYADLAIKNAAGYWHIDYAAGGFGAWNWISSTTIYGGSTTRAIPASYDGSGHLDLAIQDGWGRWRMDLGTTNSGSYGAWNTVPGMWSSILDNPNRVLVDYTAPHIEWTKVYDANAEAPLSNGVYQLRVGVRYTAAVRVNAGNGQYTAGVEVNPDLYVPASLNLVNAVGSTGHVPITQTHTRRFAFTCSQPGSFPLGFQMRDITPPTGTGNSFNPDYGIRVECTAAQTGLYGTVTTRTLLANGRYVAGTPIVGALVQVGATSTTTASNGTWRVPATGGPHRVTISAAGFSTTVAVNVTVPPGAGVQIDTPLEESFSALAARGMSYTTYIDYSRGRTILHTVRVPTANASVKLGKSPLTASPPNTQFQRLATIAATKGLQALAMINGGYFDTTGLDASVGYLYVLGYVGSFVNPDGTDYPAEPGPPAVIEAAYTQPMLAITGTSTGQQVQIVESEADFLSTTSSSWAQVAGTPIWDKSPRDGFTDVSYALQCTPYVLKNGSVIWRGVPNTGTYHTLAWARTAVGVGNGMVYLVVADGEGVNGGNGATWHQLGEFFRDELGAATAMHFDSGLSSEMILRTASGHRKVNTITGEDSSWDIDPTTQVIVEADGGPGSVHNYLMAGAP